MQMHHVADDVHEQQEEREEPSSDYCLPYESSGLCHASEDQERQDCSSDYDEHRREVIRQPPPGHAPGAVPGGGGHRSERHSAGDGQQNERRCRQERRVEPHPATVDATVGRWSRLAEARAHLSRVADPA